MKRIDEFHSGNGASAMPSSVTSRATAIPVTPWTGVDYLEAGAGPLVVLVHCSMSNARQWQGLVQALASRFRLRAINLYGYGRTPAWPGTEPPTLDDYAELVLAAIPDAASGVAVIGHSFGGAVAMQAARRLGRRAGKLVLIEPSLFYLLQQGGRAKAYAEIAAVAERMKRDASAGALETAAKDFVSYWAGAAAWAETPAERKAASSRYVPLVLQEFNAVLAGRMTPAEWRAALPLRTLLVSAAETTRAAREVVEVLAGAGCERARVPEGGHMSPITRAGLVNPVIADYLDRP